MADKPTGTKISGPRKAAMKGGRFTPKGTAAPVKGKTGDASAKSDEPKGPAYASSGRYTAPSVRADETPAEMQETKSWVVPLMILLLILGLLLIINYYVGVLPGGRSGWYLIGGLAAITGGFGVATQLK